MAKYDGLIIPRSYNDYINKSSPIDVSQALQLTGVMDNVPTAQSTKPAKSGGIFAANAVIMASNKTLSGVAISAGSVVRVLFTAALTGSDAETGLTLTYNGNAYAVKVGKDGALVALTAHLIEESYIYLQAYTTLELAFDGSQFVVMGNPVVISKADFSIMADGSNTQQIQALVKNTEASIGRALRYFGTFDGSELFANNIGRVNLGSGGWCYIANPRVGKQFPVNNDSPYNLYIAINAFFDIFCDYENSKVYVRCNYDYGSGWHALW